MYDTHCMSGTDYSGAHGAAHRCLASKLKSNSITSACLTCLQGGVTLQSLVRDHWESISRSHFRSSLKWADAPAWDTLWSLTRALYSKQLQPGSALKSPQQQSGSGPSTTTSAHATSAAAGQLSQPATTQAPTQGSTAAAPPKAGILSFLRAGAAIPSSTSTPGSSTTPGTAAKSQAGMEQPAGQTTQHEGVVAAAGDGRSEAKKSEGEVKRQENERRAAAYRQQWAQYLEDQVGGGWEAVQVQQTRVQQQTCVQQTHVQQTRHWCLWHDAFGDV
jgi:hypothetical protein